MAVVWGLACPESDWPAIHFQPSELACKGSGALMVDEIALDRLDRLRDLWGKPLVINSGYRSPAHNRKVDGAKNSQHLYGRAFDISTFGWSDEDYDALYELAKDVGFTGFGFYADFLHVDTGPAREWRG